MIRTLLSFFILLHGLVHVWYVVLSQRLVMNLQNVGWTGRSWIFTNLLGDSATRTLASILYILAAVGFVISSAGILAKAEWARWGLVLSAVLSAATIVLFWDGVTSLLIERGLLGLLISLAILSAVLLFR